MTSQQMFGQLFKPIFVNIRCKENRNEENGKGGAGERERERWGNLVPSELWCQTAQI